MPDLDLTSAPSFAELFCSNCGYDLRGIDSDRCPECGTAIDRELLSKSAIPWVHRKTIGRFRAFLATIWLVTLHPGRLAREMARPGSYRDAQIFRWVVVLLLWIPGCVFAMGEMNAVTSEMEVKLSGMLYRNNRWGPPQPTLSTDLMGSWVSGISIWPVQPLAVLIIIVAWTGIPSYFFHPTHLHVVRQNRGIALSYYACAPLSLLLVASALYVLVFSEAFSYWLMVGEFSGHPLLRTLAVAQPVARYSFPVIVILWLRSTLWLCLQAVKPGLGAALTFIVAFPLLCALAGVLAIIGLPMACGFLRIMFESYWV